MFPDFRFFDPGFPLIWSKSIR